MERRQGDDRYLRGLEALDSRPPTAAPAPASTTDDLWAATVPGTTPRAAPRAAERATPQPMRAQQPTAAPRQPVDPANAARRRSIRSTGPVVALIVPAALGATALLLLWGSTSTGRGVGGFALALLAAPALPAAGVPLRIGAQVVLLAIAASALLWLGLGWFAARRATRGTPATWARFWGEFAWMAVAVWAGTGLAVLGTNLVLGRSLL
jgi:hypothetical protein